MENRGGSKNLLIILGLLLLVGVFYCAKVFAVTVKNTSLLCSDVNLVFARGSSDNEEGLYLDEPFREKSFGTVEKVSGAFFRSIQYELDAGYPKVSYKAVSVHNFPNLGSDAGYRAVPIFQLKPLNLNNAIDAEWFWWPWGEYRQSMQDGATEMTAYIRDEMVRCPNEHFVVGGYSQGADVADTTIFGLNSEERKKVDSLVMFGDPKYLGAKFDKLNPFSKAEAYPWKRGTSGLKDTGLADARIPYVPDDMVNKTISWCFVDDFVCSGYSGAGVEIKDMIGNSDKPSLGALGSGHSRYSEFGAAQAGREVVQKMSLRLAEINGNYDSSGILDEDNSIIGSNVNSQPIDLMFMVNDSYGNDDVLGQLRVNGREVLNNLATSYSDLSFGLGSYGEYSPYEETTRVPRAYVNLTQDKNLSRFESAAVNKLAYGGLSGGGYDPADPHGIGIEKAVMGAGWRADSRKVLFVFTPRPTLESITYNICNSQVRNGFDPDNPQHCFDGTYSESADSSRHSEYCIDTKQMLTETFCKLTADNYGYYRYNITRKFWDAINLAKLKGVQVNFIIPSEFNQGLSTGDIDLLKRASASTGGITIKYPSFDKASFVDSLYRVLASKPKLMSISSFSKLGYIGGADSGLLQQSYVSAITGSPTQLQIETSLSNPTSYDWDFDADSVIDETTNGPTVEHAFTNETKVIVTVTDLGGQTTTAEYPVVLTPGESTPELPAPSLPNDIKLKLQANGDLLLTWTDSRENCLLFIGDKLSGVPIKSTVCSAGTLTTSAGDYPNTTLQVWVAAVGGQSLRQDVNPVVEVVGTKDLRPSESGPFYPFEYYLQLAKKPVPVVTAPTQSSPSISLARVNSGNVAISTNKLTEVAGATDQTPVVQKSLVSEARVASKTKVPATVKLKSNLWFLAFLLILFLVIAQRYRKSDRK